MPPSKLVRAFFDHYQQQKSTDDHFWAFEDVMDTVASNPVEAWNLVVELINEAPSLSALTFVAAGPLESLIDKHGKLVIDSLEQSLCNNKRLQFAIVGVWLDEGDELYAKLESLKQTYNLNEINPLNNSPWSETNPMPG